MDGSPQPVTALLEDPAPERPVTARGGAAAAWGLAGIALLLGNAIWRLTPVAWEGLADHRLASWQWVVTVAWIGGMVFFEGYRGFQRGFAPRVVARASYLARNAPPLRALLAPMFCMGLLHASRRRLVVSWSLLLGILTLVLVVRTVPQPYRGMIDAGVVAGLLWGLGAVVYFAGRALAGHPPRMPLELGRRR